MKRKPYSPPRTRCGILIMVTLAVVTLFLAKTFLVHDDYITIDSKGERCPSGKNSCFYVVFSKEGEIYENVDMISHFKFNSGSLQAKLQVGERYKVTLAGWRIPILSMRENIIRAEEADVHEEVASLR